MTYSGPGILNQVFDLKVTVLMRLILTDGTCHQKHFWLSHSIVRNTGTATQKLAKLFVHSW